MKSVTPDPTQVFAVWYDSVRSQVETKVSPYTFQGMYAKTQNKVKMMKLYREWMQTRQTLGLAAPNGTALDR